MRWKIKKYFHFKNQQFKFEDLHVMSLNTIYNLNLFTILITCYFRPFLSKMGSRIMEYFTKKTQSYRQIPINSVKKLGFIAFKFKKMGKLKNIILFCIVTFSTIMLIPYYHSIYICPFSCKFIINITG